MLIPLALGQWQTWLIILLVVVVLFGATRLPALSKSLGQSIKIFRKEVKSDNTDDAVVTSESSTDADAGTTSGSSTDKS